jgi:CRISPR-associated endonuclease Csn1
MRIIGLDLGITSVGSAVVDLNETEGTGNIVFAGARVFPAAEHPKTGASLALPRRVARGMRRRIDRRRFRLDCLWTLLAEDGLTDAVHGPEGFQNSLQSIRTAMIKAGLDRSEAALKTDPYFLRVEALDRKLEDWEWIRVLMHIAARRGFRSNSKAAESDDSTDTGKMNKAIKETQALFEEVKARTVGEFIANSAKFAEHKRNKSGSYALTLKRDWLREELKILFSKQRDLGNLHTNKDLEEQFITRFYEQKHYDQGNIDEMIGFCQFEPTEQRAAKATWTFQHAMALQKINHLRWSAPGKEPAQPEETQRKLLLELAIKSQTIKYEQVRRHLELSDDVRFNGLSYRTKRDKAGLITESDPVKASETATFIELKALHALRKKVKDHCGINTWESLFSQPIKLDAIGSALSKFKADEKRIALMQSAGVADEVIQASLTLSFDGFGFLSLTALKKLIPHLEAGARYDEAATTEYKDHRGTVKVAKTKLLPQIPVDEVRNPVVLRALSQTRKVLNALIREFGTPNRLHIEMGRDIGKNRDERNKVKDGQEVYREEKEQAAKVFRETFPQHGEPKGNDLLLFRLWREQDKQCIYSGEYIKPDQLLALRHVEIDHVLPLSRSQDDGMHNKVLCLTRENQSKGKRTPYEWLDGANDSDRWRAFELRVTSLRNIRKPKRDRLLRVDFTDATAEGFKERNLVDTRYIARYFKNFVETHLQIQVLEGEFKNAVQTGSGKLTSFLRAQWGLLKVRDASDRHHALDAIVIACATKSMEHRLTRYHQAMEIYTSDPREAAQLLDVNTGEITSSHYRDLRKQFPKPWHNFRDDVVAALDKVFVSRPPRRKWSGALHDQTVYGLTDTPGVIKQRVRIENVKLTTLEKAVEPGRNQPLYDAIRNRLNAHANNEKKAWAEPLFYDLGGTKRLVRAITIEDKMGDGVHVRGGIAANAEIVRVDVYKDAKGKNYLVPIYISDFGKETPNHAIAQGKPKSEWPEMDGAFEFSFALYKDDLIEIEEKGIVYFSGVHSRTSNINVSNNDRSIVWEGVGPRNLKVFNKLSVDVLGRVSTIKKERHLALAKRTN